MIKYELKKYILRKRTLIVVLLCMVGYVAFLIYGQLGYFHEKSGREDFFRQISSMSTADLEKEFEKAKSELYMVDEEGNIVYGDELAKGTYGKTRLDDYDYLSDAVEYAKKKEKRNANVKLLREDSNLPTYMRDFYEVEKNQKIVDLLRVDAFVENMKMGIPVVICIVAVCGFAFSEERGKAYVAMTQKGMTSVIFWKWVTALLYATVLHALFTILFFLSELILLGDVGEILAQPLFFVSGFEQCVSGITVGTLFLLQNMMSLIMAFLEATIVLFVSRCIRKNYIAVIVSGLILAVGFFVNYYYAVSSRIRDYALLDNAYLLPEVEMEKILKMDKMFNPMSLLDVSYYFQKPRYVELGGYAYPVVFFTATLFVGLFLAVLSGMFYRKKGE